MKQGWESDNKMITKRFDEVFDLSLGRTPSRGVDAYWGGCHSWVSIADMSCGKYISETKESITDKALVDTNIPIVKKGTVIMSFKLSIGKVCIADTDLYTNEAIMAFVPKPQYKVLPEYLYYYLMFYKWDNSNEVVLGFTLNKKTISQSIVTIPSLTEQKRIVEILDREFEKIDALKGNAEKNLQHAKDLFQSALKQELQPKEGWKTKTIGDVCDIQGGSTPKRTERLYWENGTYPWFTVEDIREQGRVINDTKQKITQLAWDRLRIFPKDTVLLCCTASLGEHAITNIALTSNQQFNGLIIKNRQELNPMYLLHFCATLKEELVSLSGKATIDFVSSGKVKQIKIPFPPLTNQEQIVARLDRLQESCKTLEENYKKTIALCDDMKQALLRKAFNGEL